MKTIVSDYLKETECQATWEQGSVTLGSSALAQNSFFNTIPKPEKKAETTLSKFQNATDIVNWMDDANCRLKDCYRDCCQGLYSDYTLDMFNKDLNDLANGIKESKCDNTWDEVSFSRCLYGLNGLPALPAVQNVLKALTEKIQQTDTQFNSQAIGNALYGLKDMTLSAKAVQNLLKALIKRIDADGFDEGVSLSTLLIEKYNPLKKPQLIVPLLKILGDGPYQLTEDISKAAVKELEARHIRDGVLDLQDLDYLSAEFLLYQSETQQINTIIFSDGSPSKANHQNTMAAIVSDYLAETGYLGIWSQNSVSLDMSAYAIVNKP